MELDGRRLVDRAAAVLREVAAPVIEVGPVWAPGLASVREDPPGSPLAALWAGAHGVTSLLITSKFPFIEPNRLVDRVVSILIEGIRKR